MSIFDIIDTWVEKIKSYKNDYIKAIKETWAKADSAIEAIWEWILTWIQKPVEDILSPVKKQVDNIRLKAQEFETGIQQYHQIKNLEKKPFVDLTNKEQDVYKTFLDNAKDYWNTYSKIKQESWFTVMQPEIDSNKKALILWINTKQKQYDKYKDNIINKIYWSSTWTNIAWQTFAQIFDKWMTWERSPQDTLAERLTYWTAWVLGNTAKVFYDNINPSDENETAYNIWNNAQLSNFDKIIKTSEYVAKKIQLDLPLSWQWIDQTKLETSKQKHFDEASKKIWKNLSWLMDANWIWDIAWKTWWILAGYVDFFTAPIMPFFEEEVTGKTIENIWTILSLPFQALSSATSESLQAFWVEKETADNWGTVVWVIWPSAIRSWKIPTKVVKDISAETAFIAWLPKDYQKMYVDTKIQVNKMQDIETKLNNQTAFTELKSFWVISTWKYVKTTKPWEWISTISSKVREFLTAMKEQNFTKAQEIKLELDNTYTTLKEQASKIQTPKWGWDSKRASINLTAIFEWIKDININKKSIEDLTNIISSLPIKNLTSNAIKSSIAQSVAKHTNDMWLSLDEMDVVTNNILGLLEEKKTNVEKTIQDLNNHIANKTTARESINSWKITKEDFDLKFKDNTWDLVKWLPENRTEFDYIKSLENSWVLKEVAKIETDTWVQRLYQSEDYNLNLTYPEDIAKIFETRNKLTDNYKLDQQEIFDFENDINAKTDFSSQLEKNFKKSWISAEWYIKKEVERVLAKKWELAKIEMEIEASKPWERIYLEREIWSGRDVVASPSTFPKWIPEELRNKKLMTSTWDKLTRWDLDIPKQNVKQQKLMSVYLEKLWSELKDIYDVDLKALTKDKDLKQIQVLKERLKNSKAFSRAYYNEYKKVNREVKVIKKRLANLKENAIETKQKLQNRLIELKDTYKNRKSIVAEIQKEYQLTDIEFDKILKTKNYLKFDEYAFKDFAYKLEEAAYKTAELNYERLYAEQKIKEKELVNLNNIYEVYELPRKLADFSLEDFKKLDEIINKFEQWDIFLSTGLMKRFKVIEDGNIFTVREAIQRMFERLPGLKEYEISQKEAWSRIYQARIIEMNQEKIDLEKEIANNPENKLDLEESIKELSNEINDIQKEFERYTQSNVKEINFRAKKDKTTHESVTEKKLIEWGWTDKISYDYALSNKNPLYNFMVESYLKENMKYATTKLEIQDTLWILLKKSRESTKRSIEEKIIPSDDIVVDYLEAKPEVKTQMILENKLTRENLELANYVQELFLNYKKVLSERKVIDKFLDEYVTHMAKSIPEVYKDSWFKAALKQIIAKEEHKFDFWALWDRDTVLWYEKFFRYWIQRTWWKMEITKNLWTIVSWYTNTFYKKLALDQVIPEVVLYRDILADSAATKFITSWINNKKWITIDDLQWSAADKILSWLKNIISIWDLWFNAITSIASIWWVVWANYIVLWGPRYATWLARKTTSQWRKILKDYEAKIWRNPLWSLWKEVLENPNITPLEVPVQLAFTMLWQTLQTWLNTAFLWMLSKEEFETGKISDERFAKIWNELWAWHALPSTSSVYWSTFLGKATMMYKNWAIPLLYTNARLAKRLSPDAKWNFKNSTSYKEWTYIKDLKMFGRSMMIPIALYVLISNWFEWDDESYIKKRFKQEITSPLSAIDWTMWLWVPRIMWKISNILLAIKQLYSGEEYKTTKEWEYSKWDLKWWKNLQKEFTPWFIKQFTIIWEELIQEEKKNTKSSKKKIKIQF